MAVAEVVDGDARELHHADAGQACPGLGQHNPLHGFAQLGQQLGRGGVHVHRRQHHRVALQALGDGRGGRPGLMAQGEEPTLEGLDQAAALQPLGAPGQHDLGRVLQIKRQLGRALAAPFGPDFQARQDQLLQPGRAVGAQRARRYGVNVQAPAQAAHAVGVAKGPLAGGEVVEHHAQGKQVAARVIADELHLLGRHVRPGAQGQAELFVQQVGQVVVARQAKVDQHRLPIGPEHDVAGLDVEVDHVLAVQRMHGGGHPRADLDHLVDRQRRGVQARLQGVALDLLHHDVRRAGEVALGDEGGHARATQRRHDHLLDLEADDGRRVFVAAHPRHLHQQRQARVALVVDLHDPPQMGHAAAVQPLLQAKAVDDLPGLQRGGSAVGGWAIDHRPGGWRATRAARWPGSWPSRAPGRRARGGRSGWTARRRTRRSRRPGCRPAAGRPSPE